jgi:hypothetical protein
MQVIKPNSLKFAFAAGDRVRVLTGPKGSRVERG